MPLVVVDALEVVEIEHRDQHRVAFRKAPGALLFVGCDALEIAPVAQAGQRVGGGRASEARVGVREFVGARGDLPLDRQRAVARDPFAPAADAESAGQQQHPGAHQHPGLLPPVRGNPEAERDRRRDVPVGIARLDLEPVLAGRQARVDDRIGFHPFAERVVQSDEARAIARRLLPLEREQAVPELHAAVVRRKGHAVLQRRVPLAVPRNEQAQRRGLRRRGRRTRLQRGETGHRRAEQATARVDRAHGDFGIDQSGCRVVARVRFGLRGGVPRQPKHAACAEHVEGIAREPRVRQRAERIGDRKWLAAAIRIDAQQAVAGGQPEAHARPPRLGLDGERPDVPEATAVDARPRERIAQHEALVGRDPEPVGSLVVRQHREIPHRHVHRQARHVGHVLDAAGGRPAREPVVAARVEFVSARSVTAQRDALDRGGGQRRIVEREVVFQCIAAPGLQAARVRDPAQPVRRVDDVVDLLRCMRGWQQRHEATVLPVHGAACGGDPQQTGRRRPADAEDSAVGQAEALVEQGPSAMFGTRDAGTDRADPQVAAVAFAQQAARGVDRQARAAVDDPPAAITADPREPAGPQRRVQHRFAVGVGRGLHRVNHRRGKAVRCAVHVHVAAVVADQSPPAADPEIAVMADDRQRDVVGQPLRASDREAGSARLRVLDAGKLDGALAFGADPEPRPVRRRFAEQAAHGGAGKRVDRFACRLGAAEQAGLRADPHAPVRRLPERADRGRRGRSERDAPRRRRIVAAPRAGTVGADPQCAVPGLRERADRAGSGFRKIDCLPVAAVVVHESMAGSGMHVAIRILQQREHGVVRQAVGAGEHAMGLPLEAAGRVGARRRHDGRRSRHRQRQRQQQPLASVRHGTHGGERRAKCRAPVGRDRRSGAAPLHCFT